MKILVLLDSMFPYGAGETFLETELKFYDDFDKIIICPMLTETLTPNMRLKNKKVVILRPKGNFVDGKFLVLFINMLKCLNKIITWKEILKLLNSKRLSLSTFRHLLSFISKGDFFYEYLSKELPLHIDSNDTVYLYSYWVYYQAYVACRLKKYFSYQANVNIKSIATRAHGFDLYEYRNSNDYIPLREYLFENIDKIVAISKDGSEYLKKRYGKYQSKITFSRLGTLDYGYKNYLRDNDKMKIVSCSALVPVKRIDKIINSLSLISDINIEWVHFGAGKELDNLRTLASMVLPDNISFSFVGNISNKKLMEFYENNDVDLFVNASESEGIPVSIMEAISFGIPILATNVGGVSEIVKNNYNGFLLNKKFSEDEFAKSIRYVRKMDDNNYFIMRKNCRTIWDEKYNARKNYKNFINFLEFEKL